MRRSWFRILLAVAWFFWTGVVVPIHTRGAIPVAGTAGCSAGGCCEGDSTRSPDKQKPARANCAICELTAKLSTPVTFAIELKPAGLLELLPPLSPATFVHCEFPLVQSCRGPPVMGSAKSSRTV